MDKYIVVVNLAWAHVEQRFAQERSVQVTTYGDIVRQHWDKHAIDWLQGVIEMGKETGDTHAFSSASCAWKLSRLRPELSDHP